MSDRINTFLEGFSVFFNQIAMKIKALERILLIIATVG